MTARRHVARRGPFASVPPPVTWVTAVSASQGVLRSETVNAQLLGQSTSSVKGRNGGEKQAPREGQREERVTKSQEEPGKASWRRKQLSTALKDSKNLEQGLWDSLQSIWVTDQRLDSGSPPHSHIDAEPREGSTQTPLQDTLSHSLGSPGDTAPSLRTFLSISSKGQSDTWEGGAPLEPWLLPKDPHSASLVAFR